MRSFSKALKTFVSGFNLPAYAVGSVPEDVDVPYLTYPINEPEWSQKTSFYIQGWYRTRSNAALAEKADEIIREIGTGITIYTDSGYLVIYPESPLVQFLTNGDYRSFYINLSVNSFQMPGDFPETEEPGATTPEEGETSDAET